jgi:rod shape-determining protein MreC
MVFFRKKAFALLFLSVLCLILLFSPKAKGALKVFFMQAFKIPLKAAGAVQKVPSVLPKGKLARENILLKEKIKELESQVQDLKEIDRENQRLRGLLDFKKRREFSTISAQVIARDLSIWSDTAIIDKGSSGGIAVNMAVVTEDGLAGRITEAGTGISRVLLITDPDSRVGAVLQDSRELGIVEGTLRSVLKMRYLNIDADVREGDTVLTSGFGGNFPKGILIGKGETGDEAQSTRL